MAAAHITGTFFSAIIGIYIARTLMPEALGYLSYALTLIFFFSNFIDLGLSTYGLREIASNRPRFSEYVSEIVSFRLLIAFALFLIFILTALLLPEKGIMKALVAESSLIFFIWALATEWAFQGIEKMHMVFISFAFTGAAQLGLVYLFVKGPRDILKVPLLYIASSVPVTAAFLYRARFNFRISREHLKTIYSYLASSVIIWSISVLAQVYNNLDIFILGLFRSIGEVGCFTIARRVVGGFAILMIFLANAILPQLSSSFATRDEEEFLKATRKFLKLAIIITVFMLAPFIILSKKIITLAVGAQYAAANEPLGIMIVGVVMILFNLPYSTALIAAHFEKEVLKQAAASATLSIFLNLVLIPKYGMIGASISFVAAEALALALILLMYREKIHFRIGS